LIPKTGILNNIWHR